MATVDRASIPGSKSIEFHAHGYLAFQLGAHRLAAAALAEMPEEAARLRRAALRYEAELRARLL